MRRTDLPHLAPALTLTLALVLTATASPPARSSTGPPLLDADEALARARAFLAAGRDAPRPDLANAAFDVVPVEERRGPAFDLHRRAPDGRLLLYLRLERTRGHLLALVQPERDATDATPRPRRPRAELLERAERLARRLLGRPPGELLDETRLEGGPGTLRLHGFTFAAAPDEEQLQVDLNPETGDVVAARRLGQASSEIEPPEEPATEPGTATHGRQSPDRSPPNVGSTR